MTSPKFSVIIPAYNNADFLGDAIQSVLDQTSPDFEIIVVNDASPDHTPEVIGQFHDPRIKYITHEINRGLAAARNSGMRASSGEYIALLDGDDFFHPEKLRLHFEFLEKHPEVGVTYNSRFELNHSARTIREVWRPPLTVSLSDLVLGFPFGPSDMVLRHVWAFRVNLFDESYTYFGEDLDINCRLALAGCKFASVDRALNYRRYHSGRIIKNLREYQEAEIKPLYKIFADPQCPPEVLALRNIALSNRYLGWTNVAFAQEETALGQEFCLKAFRLNPSILDGNPCQLVASFISYSILDESRDHDELLRRIFSQLPPEMRGLSIQCEQAVAHAYLLKGIRAIIWDHIDDGREYLSHAAALGAQIDDTFLQGLTYQLLNYETEFGTEAIQNVLQNLIQCLKKVGFRNDVKKLKGCYLVNRAFKSYHVGEYNGVPKEVMRAILNDPRYLVNCGVISILIHSIFAKMRNNYQHYHGNNLSPIEK